VWGAEYQESQGVLVEGEAALATLRRICAREAAPVAGLGTGAGPGRIRVLAGAGGGEKGEEEGGPPLVDLPLQPLLSHRPRRVINATAAVPPPWQPPPTSRHRSERPLQQPPSSDTDIDLRADLRAVLGLVSVGSKAFLTNKVDRSVTGLVAAQPCVGPLGLPVGDVGVAALSYWGRDGVASALGECPGVGLLDVEVRRFLV
jgi:phosphoribosylformylglycinamidine synthase